MYSTFRCVARTTEVFDSAGALSRMTEVRAAERRTLLLGASSGPVGRWRSSMGGGDMSVFSSLQDDRDSAEMNRWCSAIAAEDVSVLSTLLIFGKRKVTGHDLWYAAACNAQRSLAWLLWNWLQPWQAHTADADVDPVPPRLNRAVVLETLNECVVAAIRSGACGVLKWLLASSRPGVSRLEGDVSATSVYREPNDVLLDYPWVPECLRNDAQIYLAEHPGIEQDLVELVERHNTAPTLRLPTEPELDPVGRSVAPVLSRTKRSRIAVQGHPTPKTRNRAIRTQRRRGVLVMEGTQSQKATTLAIEAPVLSDVFALTFRTPATIIGAPTLETV